MPAAGSRWLEIDTYWLRHWFNAGGSNIEIILSSENTRVGAIYFFSSPHREIGTVETPPFPFDFKIYDLLANYPGFIDTLRYEKPLYFYLGWDGSNIVTQAYLSTSKEPVGEQEGQGMPTTP